MWLFAQGDGAGAAAAVGGLMLLVYLAVIVVCIAGWWKVFAKAGKPGWAAIVPIYNLIVLCEIIGRPLWWVVIAIIPCTAWIALIVFMLDLAKSFGKEIGFAIGLILLGPIFICILGFGDAKYQGPSAA